MSSAMPEASEHPHPTPEREDSASEGSIFDGAVTLDPGATLRSWDLLVQDTWVLEINELPRIMHAALIHTLKERGVTKREG